MTYEPDKFLKCPNCHRRTVKLVIHADGDMSIECEWCGALAIGHGLNESDRTYGGVSE